MTDCTAVYVPQIPPANPTYNQAIRAGGIVYISGQLGIDPATGRLVPGGQVSEYRQALTNLKTILEAAGSSLARVVKTTIYMTDLDQLAELNEIYAAFFHDQPVPAKTGVEVRRLAMGASIEIEAIASI